MKACFFVERIMENMDKGLTVAKWMLIIWPKIPQMPQNLSAQLVCPSPKVLDFNKKRLHWVSIVHGLRQASLVTLSCLLVSWIFDKRKTEKYIHLL